MAFSRLSLIAAAAVLPFSLVACSSSSGGGGGGMPEGTHYKYVANQLLVPTTSAQATEFGLDLDGNGTVDNQLGMVLSTIGALGSGFNIQGTINIAVLEGTVIFLADVQTKDFTNATNAGFQVYLGKNPMPPACNAGEMATCDTQMPTMCTGCGHHLDGSGMFAIDTSGPQNAALTGKFANGTFSAGPGELSLPLTLAGANLMLNLIGAQIKATGVSATAIGSGSGTSTQGGAILAGGVTQSDLMTQIEPAVATAVQGIVERDCCGPSNTAHPTCNDPSGNCYCASGSTGSELLGFLDTMPKDCMITTAEIQNNGTISSLLSPDVMLKDSSGKETPCLSVGVKITAVPATY